MPGRSVAGSLRREAWASAAVVSGYDTTASIVDDLEQCRKGIRRRLPSGAQPTRVNALNLPQRQDATPYDGDLHRPASGLQ